MKKTTFISRLVCLALALVMTFGLCACPAGEPTGTTGTSGTSGTSGSTTGGNPNQNPGDVTDAVYADGAALDGTGTVLEEGSFATTVHTPDEANAIEAANLTNLFRGQVPAEGATYRLTGGESKISASGRTYDGNGAIIIAPDGIVIDGVTEFVLTNITIIGPVTVKNSENITFAEVDIQNPAGTALTVEETSSLLRINGSRLSGKVAVANAAEHFILTNSNIAFTGTGVLDTAEQGTNIIGCVMTGEGTGISITASESVIRQNTLTVNKDGTGIELKGSTLNTLIALNEVLGAQIGLSVAGATNSSIVRNRMITVVANGNVSLYICDNSMGGRLRAEGNNYFLADGNTFPEDGLDHSTLQADNLNTNGDTLMDVDARLEAGADENLLPHINLDLFIGMEKKTEVTDYANNSLNLAATEYLVEFAKKSPYVIIAPGRYSCRSAMTFGTAQSNTTVYGYGAYIERVYEKGVSSLGTQVYCTDTSKVTLKGLTIGFERQSCGQVYILDKYEEKGQKKVLAVTGAGMDNEFGTTNTALYNTTGMGAQREGTFYAYCDTSFKTIKKLDNGLMEMTVDPSVYEMLMEGDILTCRSVDGGRTFITTRSTDIVFKDIFVYGGSAGFAFVEEHNRTATTYYRVANTTKSGPIIDEETYNRYKVLEEQYGISTEVYIDELGRYRGSLPHIGSIDATHVIMCAQGSVAISCIFENMCDDATNQRHGHARLASIEDNGDGTSTVTYRGNWSVWARGSNYAGFGYCNDFQVGDRVFIYTADGQLVCDGEALSATVRTGRKELDDVMKAYFQNIEGSNPTDGQMSYEYYTVTVRTEDVNMAALEGFDLTAEGADNEEKVLVDNMSMASNGFIFDNCRIRNIRSRGLLIKASEGQIINCTFNHIGMACAAILYEIYWGESGVSENLVVARNVMDHTGYFVRYTSGNEDRYSPIAIEGLGSRVDEDFLLYKNIQIIDNVIRNRTTVYAVYVNSARDITIKGNDFGNHEYGESEENKTLAIHLNGAMNVEISNNKYSVLDLPVEEKIVVEHVKNIFGSDVEYNGQHIIPDQE